MQPAALSAAPLSESSTLLALAGIFLVPFAAAGLALVNTGFGRSRSAAHAMLSAMCVWAAAALGFLVVGAALAGYAGGPAIALTIGGRQWSVLGAGKSVLRGVAFDGSAASLALCLQLFAAGAAVIIPLGAGAERWRLSASCLSAAIFAAITYPILAHWMWGGGWLAQLGAVDAGGGGVIQCAGGLTALAITWLLGPRHGKYSASGMAIPGHNMVMVIFGCFFSIVGFLGLDVAGAILFAGATAAAVPLIAINNLVSASMALLTALIVTRVRYHKPDASISANGLVIGLVAISGCCSLVPPAAAAAIGLAAGLAVPFSVEWLDRLGFDDPSGVISVHGLGGIWGVLAVGFFAQGHALLPQLALLSALLGVTLPLSYGLNLLLDRFHPQRASREAERLGMDMHELGAGAYPELAQAIKEQQIR